MKYLNGLPAFMRFLEEAAIAVPTVIQPSILKGAAKVVKKKVRSIYGTEKLRDLEESTQTERMSLGLSANQPLLRDGKLLRDSVTITRPYENAIIVGSNEVIHAYHEYGYDNVRTGTHVDPRPVFKIAAAESLPDV